MDDGHVTFPFQRAPGDRWTLDQRLGLFVLCDQLRERGWTEEALRELVAECIYRDGPVRPQLAQAWGVESARELLRWLGCAPNDAAG